MWIICRQELLGARARSRGLSVSFRFFSLLASPTCQSSPKSSPSRTAFTATPATWEERTGTRPGRAGAGVGGGGTGRIGLGPDPCPSPLAKAGGVRLRPGLPPPPRRAAAGPAGCWREEGGSRAPRPARPRERWQAGRQAGSGLGGQCEGPAGFCPCLLYWFESKNKKKNFFS